MHEDGKATYLFRLAYSGDLVAGMGRHRMASKLPFSHGYLMQPSGLPMVARDVMASLMVILGGLMVGMCCHGLTW